MFINRGFNIEYEFEVSLINLKFDLKNQYLIIKRINFGGSCIGTVDWKILDFGNFSDKKNRVKNLNSICVFDRIVKWSVKLTVFYYTYLYYVYIF